MRCFSDFRLRRQVAIIGIVIIAARLRAEVQMRYWRAGDRTTMLFLENNLRLNGDPIAVSQSDSSSG